MYLYTLQLTNYSRVANAEIGLDLIPYTAVVLKAAEHPEPSYHS